jgi:hypothetical protein
MPLRSAAMPARPAAAMEMPTTAVEMSAAATHAARVRRVRKRDCYHCREAKG